MQRDNNRKFQSSILQSSRLYLPPPPPFSFSRFQQYLILISFLALQRLQTHTIKIKRRARA